MLHTKEILVLHYTYKSRQQKNGPRSKESEKQLQADYLRERIYSGITLLGVSAGLLANTAYISASYALTTIVSAALGIGLASIFAELVSYRVIHDRAIPRREFLHHLRTHRAFLVAAAPSLIFIPAAALSIMTLRTALVIDIVLGVFSLFVILIRSAVTPKNTLASITVSIGIQAIIAALVIGLKIVK